MNWKGRQKSKSGSARSCAPSGLPLTSRNISWASFAGWWRLAWGQ